MYVFALGTDLTFKKKKDISFKFKYHFYNVKKVFWALTSGEKYILRTVASV